MKSALKKYVLLAAGLIGLALVTCLFLVWLHTTKESSVTLPAENDIKRMVAWADDHNMGIRPLPEFSINPKYFSVILSALSPAEKYDYPAGWDEQILGHLAIETKAGRTINIAFCESGQNPLCYRINEVRYKRAGEYKPIDDAGVYIDESLVFYSILRAIKTEEEQNSSDLKRQIDYLRRSKGELASRP